MKLIEKILMANDFSKASENVVQTAIEFAKIFQTEVVPIHVLPDDIDNEKVRTLLLETATEKLRETVEVLKSEEVITGEPILTFGSPHSKIVEAAVNTNASLILTGSGETEKGEKTFLGTTTSRIIQRSEKPVFVVKENSVFNVERILCPVDFSATSKRALKNAITMARRFSAELLILSVCELQGTPWFGTSLDLARENEKRFTNHEDNFEKFLADFKLVGLNWKKESRKGNPGEEILNAVSENQIDLLVMGSTGKTGLSRFVIGSVTEKVTREVPCSFMTLKSEDIISLQLETNIRDIEIHYNTAMQLMEDGFFDEAIEQLKLCLSINNMHVPSHFGIAKVYDKMENPEKAEVYRKSGRGILAMMWDQKIEDEVRKMKRF